MTEMAPKRNRNLVALGLVGLAFCADVVSAEASPVPSLPGQSANKPVVLVPGSNISHIPILRQESTNNVSFALLPKSQKDIEDLAIIFDQRVSDRLVTTAHRSKQVESAGYIVESAGGKTLMEEVIYYTKSGVVEVVAPLAKIHGRLSLYTVSNSHTGEKYQAIVDPQTKTHGPTVSFEHTNP